MATESEWRRRVQAWRASGESATQFAARAGYNARTLTWWSSRLRAKASPPVRFVRVVAPETPASPATVDVVLASGRVVRVGPRLDPALLRGVIAALEQA